MGNDQQDSSAQVAIEKEKTKRYFAFLGVGGVIVLIVVVYFFNRVETGSLEVNKDGFKVNIERPLIQQVASDQQQASTELGNVSFTTGTINDSVIRKVEQLSEKPVRPDQFTGKNLIDRKGGFVIASGSPNAWKVNHNDGGYTDMEQSMVTISSLENTAHITVSRIPRELLPGCSDLKCVVDFMVGLLLQGGVIAESPIVQYDNNLRTAFLTFTNQQTQGETYVKYVQTNGYWYEAKADYNKLITSAPTKKDVVNMVASFAAIE